MSVDFGVHAAGSGGCTAAHAALCIDPSGTHEGLARTQRVGNSACVTIPSPSGFASRAGRGVAAQMFLDAAMLPRREAS